MTTKQIVVTVLTVFALLAWIFHAIAKSPTIDDSRRFGTMAVDQCVKEFSAWGCLTWLTTDENRKNLLLGTFVAKVEPRHVLETCSLSRRQECGVAMITAGFEQKKVEEMLR